MFLSRRCPHTRLRRPARRPGAVGRRLDLHAQARRLIDHAHGRTQRTASALQRIGKTTRQRGPVRPRQPLRRPRPEAGRHRDDTPQPRLPTRQQRVTPFRLEMHRGGRARTRHRVGRHRRPACRRCNRERQRRALADTEPAALDRRPSRLETAAHQRRQLGRLGHAQHFAPAGLRKATECGEICIGTDRERQQLDPRTGHAVEQRSIFAVDHEAVRDQHQEPAAGRRSFEPGDGEIERRRKPRATPRPRGPRCRDRALEIRRDLQRHDLACLDVEHDHDARVLRAECRRTLDHRALRQAEAIHAGGRGPHAARLVHDERNAGRVAWRTGARLHRQQRFERRVAITAGRERVLATEHEQPGALLAHRGDE